MREKQLCRHPGQRRSGGAPSAGAEIPLQPVEKTVVSQAVPLQPREVHGGADPHLHPVEETMVSQAVALQPREVRGGADPHLHPVEDPTPEQVDVP